MSTASGYITIAVTGHRDLRERDIPALKSAVSEAFDQMAVHFEGAELRLLTARACGADSLVESVARERGIGVLPIVLNDHGEAEEQGDEKYVRIGKRLVAGSGILLALWDGVDNGKPGGTAHVVKMARSTPLSESQRLLSERQLDRRMIWHISTPRDCNQHPAFSPFVVRIEERDHETYSNERGTLNYLLKRAKSWQSWFALFFILTVVFGYVGLHAYCQIPDACTEQPIDHFDLNVFWNTLGLLILETQPDLQHSLDGFPRTLVFAEFMGALTFATAAIAAFVALFTRSLGLRFAVWRRSRRKNYSVVIGLGWTGLEIVQDLARQGRKVVVVDVDPDPGRLEAAKEAGALVVTGDATQQVVLDRSHLARAKAVFVVAGSAASRGRGLVEPADETNTRILFQMASLIPGKADAEHYESAPDNVAPERIWYVHIGEARARTLAHRSVRLPHGTELRTFNLFETCARRVLRDHPIDRLPQSANGERQMIVAGYNPLARALLHEAMQIGHYPHGKVRYTVLAHDHIAAREDWLERYPGCQNERLFKKEVETNIDPDSFRRSVLPIVRAGNGSTVGRRTSTSRRELAESDGDHNNQANRKSLRFDPLPYSDLRTLEDDFDFGAVAGGSANLYICLDDGLESARFAATILPRLQALKQNWDVQVFIYYDYPERTESLQITEGLNLVGSTVFVTTFDSAGSTKPSHRRDLVQAVRDEKRELLAQQINAVYHMFNDYEPAEKAPAPTLLNAVVPELSTELRCLPKLREVLKKAREEEEKTREEEGSDSKTAEENYRKAGESYKKMVLILRHLWEHRDLVERLGQVLWIEIREPHRISNRRAADHLFVKVRAAGFATGPLQRDLDPRLWDEHAPQLAELEHERWGADLVLTGFTPLGPENRARWLKGEKKALQAQKSHAALISYEDLDVISRIDKYKDLSQVQMIPWLLAVANIGLNEWERGNEDA